MIKTGFVTICLLMVSLVLFNGCFRGSDARKSVTTDPASLPTNPISGEIPSGLFLRMTNVPEEGVVRTNIFALSGVTAPDAVVSVNGVVVEVDSSGRFSTTISLLPEPNLIQVVASDFHGNQVSTVLTIIYAL